MSLIKSINDRIIPTSIDDFKSVISKRDGLARNNRFAVVITQPRPRGLLNLSLDDVLTSFATDSFNPRKFINDPRDLAIMCESCIFPGKAIMTVEHSMYRNAVKKPTGYVNEDASMVFVLTNDYYAKKFFEEWQDLIIDRKTYIAGYKDEYVSDVIIHQLDLNNFPIYSVTLKNAFPTAINSVSLDAEADNQYAKLPVTFSFDDIDVIGGISSLTDAAKKELTDVFGGLI